jgi:2-polyprenyl-6-methoxyphenol hydroxylase-like FAD-dependent oxidoreductase
MKILVSGGGIAGSAAALFLTRAGHEVRVIDRAPAFQKRGYAITLKGFGLKLMTELGLASELERCSLHLNELRLYGQDAHLLQAYPPEITERITHGQTLVYRSELHGLLDHAARRASVPARFGVHVEALEQDERGVRARLSDGTVEHADLLVVSEGVRSTTRPLVWGAGAPDEGVRPFDVVYAAATVRVDHGLDPRAIHGYVGEGRNVAFMPVGAHDLLIQCYWRMAVDTGAPSPRERLVGTFRSFAPSIRGLLDAIPPDGDVFCDSIAMITLPSLHRGRVVLLGDAGYCPTFLSGMGASLGLLGAKVLSVALGAEGADRADLEQGLRRYGETMRPIVDHFQANALQNVGNALPTGHLKSVLQGWLLQLVPPSLFARHFRHQFDVEQGLLDGVVS